MISLYWIWKKWQRRPFNIVLLTSPITNLNNTLITFLGETLSSKPGRSTVRAHSSISSSLWSDKNRFLKWINKSSAADNIIAKIRLNWLDESASMAYKFLVQIFNHFFKHTWRITTHSLRKKICVDHDFLVLLV